MYTKKTFLAKCSHAPRFTAMLSVFRFELEVNKWRDRLSASGAGGGEGLGVGFENATIIRVEVWENE